jgi:hypothetical protein
MVATLLSKPLLHSLLALVIFTQIVGRGVTLALEKGDNWLHATLGIITLVPALILTVYWNKLSRVLDTQGTKSTKEVNEECFKYTWLLKFIAFTYIAEMMVWTLPMIVYQQAHL